MTEFRFDPPLQLAGTPTVMIRTLNEAADFVRTYKSSRRPLVQNSVLHRLDGASAPLEQQHAAYAFRGWVEFEGLLAKA
jgi:hypothetical protein